MSADSSSSGELEDEGVSSGGLQLLPAFNARSSSKAEDCWIDLKKSGTPKKVLNPTNDDRPKKEQPKEEVDVVEQKPNSSNSKLQQPKVSLSFASTYTGNRYFKVLNKLNRFNAAREPGEIIVDRLFHKFANEIEAKEN